MQRTQQTDLHTSVCDVAFATSSVRMIPKLQIPFKFCLWSPMLMCTRQKFITIVVACLPGLATTNLFSCGFVRTKARTCMLRSGCLQPGDSDIITVPDVFCSSKAVLPAVANGDVGCWARLGKPRSKRSAFRPRQRTGPSGLDVEKRIV